MTNLQVFACLLAVQRRGSYTHVHNHNMNMNYARVCQRKKKTFQGSEGFFFSRFFSTFPRKQFKLSVKKFIILKAAAADQISCDTQVKRSHVLSFIKQNTKLAWGSKKAAQKINSLPQKKGKKEEGREGDEMCAS